MLQSRERYTTENGNNSGDEGDECPVLHTEGRKEMHSPIFPYSVAGRGTIVTHEQFPPTGTAVGLLTELIDLPSLLLRDAASRSYPGAHLELGVAPDGSLPADNRSLGRADRGNTFGDRGAEGRRGVLV